MKFLEDNMKKYLHDLEVGKYFFNKNIITKIVKRKILILKEELREYKENKKEYIYIYSYISKNDSYRICDNLPEITKEMTDSCLKKREREREKRSEKSTLQRGFPTGNIKRKM